MRKLLLTRLIVRNFRNLERVELEPAARFNVIAGKNGHGKTSLLESIYFAATSRSFRTHKSVELVRHGERVASVRTQFDEVGEDGAQLSREQIAAIEGGRVTVKIDGNKPPSLVAYATRSPVVVFHPEELTLSTGPAIARRRLLDRLALYLEPTSAQARAHYGHALKSRQRILQQDAGASGAIDAFEDLCARYGAEITRARRVAAACLIAELRPAFARIAAPDVELEAAYAPAGAEDADLARAELGRQRARDAHRTTAGFGPHRDDLELRFGGRVARLVGSQGQHRALTLALKAAETATIAAATRLEPILLLDDVSSELDADRTAALFEFLTVARGQLFLTTTRRELIATDHLRFGERCDFDVLRGVLTGSK